MTTPAAAAASAGSALAREFPAWEIEFRGTLGVVTAWWCSPDGRSRRYVVRRSGADLLTRLREIGPVPGSAAQVR